MKKESRLLRLSFIRYAVIIKNMKGNRWGESILEKRNVRGIISVKNKNDAEHEK